MDHVSNRADLDQIRAEVHRIESEPSFDFAAAEASVTKSSYHSAEQAEPDPIPEELPPVVDQFDDIEPDPKLNLGSEDGDAPDRQPFGEWLLAQKDRKGWIADLAKWAKSEPRFRRSGTPDDVRKMLTEVRAEGDAFEALDDAELDWLAL